jgi:CRISPR-associated protein Csm1
MSQKVNYNLHYASGLALAIPIVLGLDKPETVHPDKLFESSEWMELTPQFLATYLEENSVNIKSSFLQAADWASGEKLTQPTKGSIQLQAILSSVSNGPGDRWYPASVFNPHQPNGSFFPKEKTQQTNWHEVINEFTNACKAIKNLSLDYWIPAFENLLLKYTSLIPWVFTKDKDQPLLETIRLIAAFMASFVDTKEEEQKSLLMIGADLSGIQNYLFDIQSKNAAKLLKGRSFYLHLYTDAILRRILFDQGWQTGHVIYSTAGGFYLVVKDTEETRKALKEFRKELLISNYKTHGEKLYPALAWIQTDGKLFAEGKANEVFRNLAEALNQEKRKPYNGVLQDVLGLSINDSLEDENDLVDYSEDPKDIKTEDENSVFNEYSQLKLYQQQQTLGKDLLRAEGFAVWISTNESKEGIQPGGIGVFYQPFSKNKMPVDAEYLLAFNKIYISQQGIPIKTEWYGGNKYPQKGWGIPLTYDELAGGQGETLKRLGILRMDVDNLGSIFISGLPEGKRTLSRYAFISRSLDQFFKLYLNYLHQHPEKEYRNWTQVLYAGGDDLFILGRWDVVLEFAQEIRNSFKEYCGNNPALSVSGGFSMVGGKFPVIRAAHWAGEQEENAKAYKFEKREKDAIGIFDYGLSWSHEWQTVLEMKDMLHEYLVLSGNRSIIQRISQYHKIATKHLFNQDNRHPDLRWRWQMAYDFSRIKKSEQKELNEILVSIRNAVAANDWMKSRITGNEDGLTLLSIAARLVEFETRTTL